MCILSGEKIIISCVRNTKEALHYGNKKQRKKSMHIKLSACAWHKHLPSLGLLYAMS